MSPIVVTIKAAARGRRNSRGSSRENAGAVHAHGPKQARDLRSPSAQPRTARAAVPGRKGPYPPNRSRAPCCGDGTLRQGCGSVVGFLSLETERPAVTAVHMARHRPIQARRNHPRDGRHSRSRLVRLAICICRRHNAHTGGCYPRPLLRRRRFVAPRRLVVSGSGLFARCHVGLQRRLDLTPFDLWKDLDEQGHDDTGPQCVTERI